MQEETEETEEIIEEELPPEEIFTHIDTEMQNAINNPEERIFTTVQLSAELAKVELRFRMHNKLNPAVAPSPALVNLATRILDEISKRSMIEKHFFQRRVEKLIDDLISFTERPLANISNIGAAGGNCTAPREGSIHKQLTKKV